MERLERARRSLDGLSVGDAFGERYFVSPDKAVYLIQERAVPDPPWSWTDDTAMAISIVDVLAEHGRVDRDALAEAFGRRYAEEPHRGYGPTAHGILEAIATGSPWRPVATAPFGGTGSMGNGGAMRSGPVGAYFSDDYDRVVMEARSSAEPTHQHPEGQAGAIAIALASAWACRNRDATPERAADLFDTVLAHTPDSHTRDNIAKASRTELRSSVALAVQKLGNGSRIISEDTAPFSLWCAARHLGAYEEAMWTTVSGLGDRDTTCAIVGGIVIHTDAEGIPAAWMDAREPLPG
jgi:ADP-ribosylglycohydrolase